MQHGARAREYEAAIEWLCLAGLVHRVNAVETIKFPLSAYKKTRAFKLYLSDVGLLRRKFGLNPLLALQGDKLLTEFKGILSENYILQSLVRLFGREQFYWTSNNMAEVEFLLVAEDAIVPVEVKASFNVQAKSLSEYRKRYSPHLSLRFSTRNLRFDNGLLSLPLYLVDRVNEVLERQ